jgi:FlaG/FlaF family flagellin (archaellin)
MRMINDEQAVTVTIETILLFSITVILLGMVLLSFQSINNQASKTVMKEQYASIGNDIASKILDMDKEVKASLSQGSVVKIENEMDLYSRVANKPYLVELEEGNVIVQTIGSPEVTVKVPFNPDINVLTGSTLYSTSGEHVIVYDTNGKIMFKNGGVAATVDNQWPEVAIIYPFSMENIDGTTEIKVDVWDDIEVAKVEYYIDGNYVTFTSFPFTWEWDTTTVSDGTYTITALAYDRVGHYSYETNTYIVDNGLDLEAPTAEIIHPVNGSSTDFNPPTIKAVISDNIAVDNSSIKLWVDTVDVTANATITNTTIRKYTIEYIPSASLSEGTHNVELFAEELFYGSGHSDNKNVTLMWNFTIEAIPNTANPTCNINFPLRDDHLVAGEHITVTYDVSDTDSGIDYLVINVTDNQSNVYERRENVSTYPTVIYSVRSSWEFLKVYELYKKYTFNVTVYDRAGNSYNPGQMGPFTVLTGEASHLIVNYNDINTDSKEVEFYIHSSGQDIDINGLDVTFSQGKLETIYFGELYASPDPGKNLAPLAEVTFTNYRVPTTDTSLRLVFSKNFLTADNPLFITIYFKDGTSINLDITLKPTPL